MTLNGPHHSSNLFTLYKISSLIFHIYKKWLFDLIKTLFTFYRSSLLYMFFKYNLRMHQLSKAHTICQRASPKLSLRSQEKKLLDKTKNEFKLKRNHELYLGAGAAWAFSFPKGNVELLLRCLVGQCNGENLQTLTKLTIIIFYQVIIIYFKYFNKWDVCVTFSYRKV